jgi:phosphatidylserine/phosphatidylglycerophosphate/cardiolipin synthase-like enzyme
MPVATVNENVPVEHPNQTVVEPELTGEESVPDTEYPTPDAAASPPFKQAGLKVTPPSSQTWEYSEEWKIVGSTATAQAAGEAGEGEPAHTVSSGSNILAGIVQYLPKSTGTIIFLIFLGIFGPAAIVILGNLDWSGSSSGSPPPANVSSPGNVNTISIPLGYGASKGFWQVFFTAPSGSSDESTYHDGIDTYLADAINDTSSTLDIAAFEFNNVVLTEAVLDAHKRGVRVRIVTDDEEGVEDDETTIGQFIDAGIPVVNDDRSPFMHNKYMIMDSTEIWTGAWNYTVGGTYRDNNNGVSIQSPELAKQYQTDFNAMFEEGLFTSSKPSPPNPKLQVDGTPIEVYFAPQDEVVPAIIATINSAQHTLEFMAFSFTLDDVGQAIEERSSAGVRVRGIFETTASETEYSELPNLFCAGLDIMRDGNSYNMHHKVFIIDNTTVITGSFNFSNSARDDNDENLLIIQDADLAAQFTAEFERLWAEAEKPDQALCVQ